MSRPKIKPVGRLIMVTDSWYNISRLDMLKRTGNERKSIKQEAGLWRRH